MQTNPIMRKGLAVGIIVLFVGMSIIPSSAQNREKPSTTTSGGHWLYVGGSGPGNYTTIQDAVNASVDGDIVFVYDDSSPYYEHVVINKSITLMGENRDTTIIDGGRIGTIVYITTVSVNMTGFIVQNSGHGIIVENSIYEGSNYISNIISINNTYGVSLYSTDYNTISNNIITNSHWAGIVILDSCYNNVSGNRIINNDFAGILVESALPSTVGYPRQGTEGNNIFYNNISNNGWITNRTWSAGILLEATNKNHVFKNNITHNTRGVEVYAPFLTACNDNAIYQNNIMNNEYGVIIVAARGLLGKRFSTAQQNIVYQNNFIGNTRNARCGDYNIWDNGGAGNYWEHYFEWDFNHDGIGGRPYRISLFNKDRHPLMKPYPDVILKIRMK
jgi:nitrous oxidase accessory protein NosD